MLDSTNLLPHLNKAELLAQAKQERAQRQQTPRPSRVSNWRPRENQKPPATDWRTWLILAGRGFGKTRAINEWANEQANAMPGSRGMIVASTAADVRDVVVEGESGLTTLYPSIKYEPSKRRLTWANGSTATLFSADEPNSLRGPQGHWAICDELAKWRYPETFDQLMLGLRLGQNPRVAVATTPRPTEIIKRLLKDPHCAVTRGSTYDNKDNLAPAFMQQIISRYEGTRLGRQELNAEVLEDSMGALWKRSQIDALRVETMPTLRSVVVAVDPSGSKGGDECGIVVAGMGENEHGYILEDLSLQALPDQWARAAVAAYHKHKANQIIAEGNYGGEMVRLTIQTVPGAPQVKIISASHSKQARAEPVASLYEQGKIHHVGFYPQLEDELTNWEPNTGAASPNRLDALVWAMTELMLQGSIQLWL